MADCSKTEVFLAEVYRMGMSCEGNYNGGCGHCLISPICNITKFSNKEWREKVISCVQKWSDEHQNPFMWDCNYNPTNDPGKAMYIFVRDEETKKWLMELFAEKNVSSYIANNSVGKFLAIKNGFVKLDADVEIENVNKRQEDLKEARKRRNLINYAYKRVFGKEFSNGRLW